MEMSCESHSDDTVWLCTIANYSIAYLVRIADHAADILFGLWFLPYPLPSLLIGGISAAIVCCLRLHWIS